jgi:uncharacterized membrane protein
VTIAATNTAKAAAPRWMTAALFASLALNLVVVGAAAGFMWRHGGRVAEAQAPMPSNVLSFVNTLPAARQKELVARTEEQRQNVRPLRRQLRELREEAVQAMLAEPFDKDRFNAVQARLLSADQKAREAVHQLYAEIAASMTAQERRAFVDWRHKRRQMRNPLDEPDKQASDRPR